MTVLLPKYQKILKIPRISLPIPHNLIEMYAKTFCSPSRPAVSSPITHSESESFTHSFRHSVDPGRTPRYGFQFRFLYGFGFAYDIALAELLCILTSSFCRRRQTVKQNNCCQIYNNEKKAQSRAKKMELSKFLWRREAISTYQ